MQPLSYLPDCYDSKSHEDGLQEAHNNALRSILFSLWRCFILDRSLS